MRQLMMAVAAASLVAGAANAQHDGRHDRGRGDHDRGGWADHRGPGPGRFFYGGRPYDRLHRPDWAAPRGWAFQRYGVGAYLPRYFLGPSYIIDPFGLGLGLRRAPRGTHWVRVGDDLLLVSWRTGRVIEVVPDVFY